MAQEEIINDILGKSNYESIKEEIPEIAASYIYKLVESVMTYVDPNISVGTITTTGSYDLNEEVSQRITGIPSAYSAIDGDVTSLVAFAEQYSHLGVAEFDCLAKEILLDFLNLHNGLFIVQLSKLNICELSLSVPKQNGFFKLTSPVNGKIIVVPITLPFGTVKFLFCNLDK